MNLRLSALAAALGVIGTLTVSAATGLTIIFGGLFNTTADTPHLPFIAWATHTALVNSVRARAESAPNPIFSAEDVLSGTRIYDRRCASCHGGPGVARQPFAAAMTPTPPYLLDSSRRWSTGELHFVVAHGVKMTAMPAWGEVLPEKEVWQVVAFLKALPSLSPVDYAHMRVTEPTAPTSAH